MYITLSDYNKDKFRLAFLLSLLLHLLALTWFVFYNVSVDQDYQEITIDEVEFVEKSRVIKRRVKKKERKIEDFKPSKPTKEEKKLLEKEKVFKAKKIELPKLKKEFNKHKSMQSLELKNDVSKKKLRVREIEPQDLLVDKKRKIINAQELKTLLTMEEVGDKKISAKTLDILNKVKKQVRVRPDIEAKITLEDKADNLKRLDRKLANIEAPPIINMTDKSLTEMETLDIAKSKTKTIRGESSSSQEMLLLKEKDSGTISRRRAIDVRVDSRPVKIVPSKALDIKEVQKKEIKIKAPKETKKDMEIQEVKQTAQKKSKAIEIIGEIKDRNLLNSPIPEYPEWAREEGIEAIIHIYLEVDSLGEVISDSIRVEITSGYDELDDLVIETLEHWQFEPLISGTEVQSGIIVFRFKLT